MTATPEQLAKWGAIAENPPWQWSWRMTEEASDAIRTLINDLAAANVDAARQHDGRKLAQRYVGSLPLDLRQDFDRRMAELDAAHRARLAGNPQPDRDQ